MWTEKTIAGLWRQMDQLKQKDQTIGLVPTMGALHDGHLSLMREAAKQCDHVIVTLFVNPAQFGPNEDLARYPRTEEADLKACRKHGVTGVFMPSPEEIYPPEVEASGARVTMEIPELSLDLEGAARPGHFQGVCRVVMKLFNLIQPDLAFFGQKDYQQLRVVEAMVTDLNLPVDIEPCSTIREKDGLAMSSRNRYLSAEQRERALAIFMALSEAKALLISGSESDAETIESSMKAILEAKGLEVEYAVIRDAMTLKPIEGPISEEMLMTHDDQEADAMTDECPWGLVALIAVRMPPANEADRSVRLIDNMLLTLPGQSPKSK